MLQIINGKNNDEIITWHMLKRFLPKQNNALSIKVVLSGKQSELKLYGIISIEAFWKRSRKEELCVSYERDHTYPSAGYGSESQ